MKVIYYTAIFGWYDNLKDPKVVDKNAKYICFCDEFTKTKLEKQCKVWEFVVVEIKQRSLRRENRFWKINSHIALKNYDYDISVYIDGRFEIYRNFSGLLNSWLGKNNFAQQRLAVCTCIYRHGKACIRVKNDYKDLIESQMKKYKKEKFPRHYGMATNYFIVRRNNKQVANVNETWWRQVKNYSTRDQLSLMYSLWKNNQNWSEIKIPYQYNPNRFKTKEDIYILKYPHRVDYEETENVPKELEKIYKINKSKNDRKGRRNHRSR